MKKFLRILYVKVLLLLSFNVYAQDDARDYTIADQEKKQATKKRPIAQVSSPDQQYMNNQAESVPEIRRQVAEESISLYPNPVVDQLLVDVDLNEWQGGIITIKSRSGRKIAQQRIANTSTGFNLGGLNRGIYLLTVRKGGAERTIEVVKL